MTLTITQSIHPQPANPVKPIDKQPEPSRPIGRWYTDADGKLVCRWIESV
jgi:hypothetical protein